MNLIKRVQALEAKAIIVNRQDAQVIIYDLDEGPPSNLEALGVSFVVFIPDNGREKINAERS
jgi:hypothetical protein